MSDKAFDSTAVSDVESDLDNDMTVSSEINSDEDKTENDFSD